MSETDAPPRVGWVFPMLWFTGAVVVMGLAFGASLYRNPEVND